MTKKRKNFDTFFPAFADNPFGDYPQMTTEERFLSDLVEMGCTDTELDFSSTDFGAKDASVPFPNWDAVINKEASDTQSDATTTTVAQQTGSKKMDGDAVYEYDVAVHLAKHYPTGLYQGIPYIKIDGVDVPLNNRLIGSLIDNSMPMYQKRKVSARNFTFIQSWLQAILDGEDRILQRDPDLILFENGCFSIKSGKEIPQAKLKNKFLPVRIHSSWHPDSPTETPVWDQFIEDCSGGDPEIQQLILEFVAYMLAPCDPDQIILMAPAAGSGKSVLGNFTRELLGMDKTCAIALSNFGKAFEVSQIYGKVANYCLDISSAVLPDATVSTIKRLTGAGDPETINAKYKDPFPYINYAKLVFACNEGGIRLRNPDSGFERRLTVIPFLHSIPKYMIDKQLKDKLWAEREGIVWKAVQELKHLSKCGYTFSYCAEGERLKRKYMGVAEPSVQDFIDECCTLSPEEREWTSIMYKEYVTYCRENGVDPVGRKRFGQMIYSIPGVRQHKFQQNLTQLQGADGICLRN